jgi:hypothetical protein
MIKVLFDGVEINNDYIRSVSYGWKLFEKSFYLGATACRSVVISVDNRAFASEPNISEAVVYIDDEIDENTEPYFTLRLDSVSTVNEKYRTFMFTDNMVLFNKVYSPLTDEGNTVGAELTRCVHEILGNSAQVPTLPQFVYNMPLSWTGSKTYTARDLIGDIAEVCGGFACFDNYNNLVFKNFSSTPVYSVPLVLCDSFKLSSTHEIERVVWTDGVLTVVSNNSEEDGETLYLGSNNILFSDSESNNAYTIQSIVDYIGGIIKGFAFNSVTVKKCPINEEVKLGDCITINGFPSIAQIDYEYKNGWVGGYALEINNAEQEETSVQNVNDVVKYVSVTLNRELNQITSEISEVSEAASALGDSLDGLSDIVEQHTSQITQNANAITQRVSKSELDDTLNEYVTQTQLEQTAEGLTLGITQAQNSADNANAYNQQLQTYITMDISGITIGKNDSDIRGRFTNTSLDFINGNDERKAWVDADVGLGGKSLALGDPTDIDKQWRFVVSDDGNVLSITRRKA